MLSFGFCNKKIVSDLDGSPFNAVVEGMQVLGGGAGGQVGDIEGVAASTDQRLYHGNISKVAKITHARCVHHGNMR